MSLEEQKDLVRRYQEILNSGDLAALGAVVATDTVAVTIVPANPGIFAYAGTDPRPAYAYHSSSHATGVISVDGTIKVGNIGSICIGSSAALTATTSLPTGCTGRLYNYTVQPGDSLTSIRDAFVALLAADSQVTASASSEFTRILLQARVAGTAGNGIPFQVAVSTGSDLLLTAIGPAPPAPGTGAMLCCANTAGAPVTVNNAALPGETIIVYATGLGLPSLAPTLDQYLLTGQPYKGPTGNFPQNFVSGQINNATTNVLRAELVPAAAGHTDDQRDAGVAAKHVAHLGRMVDDLVGCQQREVDGHDLDHRAQAGQRGAHTHTHEAIFGDGRVLHPAFAELLEQPLRHFERAVVQADVLAHQEHAVVALHFLAQRLIQRLAVADDRHCSGGRQVTGTSPA